MPEVDEALDRRSGGHDPVPRIVWAGRIVALAGMASWLFLVARDRLTEIPTVLHLSVILFHEAGHVVFRPFGEFVAVAGGTLGQLLVPAFCAMAFARRGNRFGACIAVAWMGMSLVDAAVYAYDAAVPVLPLIGGGTGADGFHDFIYLFDRLAQLGHARRWATAMKGVGVLVASSALLRAAFELREQRGRLIE